MLNTISAYWHMIGVGVIVVVLVLVPDDHRSFSSVFTDTLNLTGWGGDPAPTSFSSPVFWYVFLTGFLMAQYTITGSTRRPTSPRRRTRLRVRPPSGCTCPSSPP